MRYEDATAGLTTEHKQRFDAAARLMLELLLAAQNVADSTDSFILVAREDEEVPSPEPVPDVEVSRLEKPLGHGERREVVASSPFV